MLYDRQGNREYLTSEERRAFIAAAHQAEPEAQTFCLTLALTGARISEALALCPSRIDFPLKGVVIESLKKRRLGIFRAVPVPESMLNQLDLVHQIRAKQSDPSLSGQRIWPWGRTTAWLRVKDVMREARVNGPWGVPKGLRHGFGVEGITSAAIPLNIIQRWLGHARIETTAIYADALGAEERLLAARMWNGAQGDSN
jgi:integrase